MQTLLKGVLSGLRPGTFRERAFRTCFGILALLAAAYGGALAVLLAHQDLSDSPAAAWQLAVACWALALAPIWLIARWESRWIVRHVQEPVVKLIQQCRDIREGRGPVYLASGLRDDELGQLAVEINALLAHFNRIVTRTHRFAADAAHELRTPLTAQTLVGENVLSRRCPAPELREAVGSMLEESKHMKRLIESLLDLTRASVTSVAVQETPRPPLPLDLGELARGCVESLQMLAEEKRQRLEVSSGSVWADADPTMVRQALLNVIHNAIEHCPAGVWIRVETEPFSAAQAMIRVRDNGPGIPLESQDHVFERFYRGPGAGKRRGLGLGLSIARAVLKSQQGNIYLRSVPGEGCCFTLVLPILRRRIPLANRAESVIER